MKKLVVLLFLLGFVAKSPAFSAVCITKTMSVCKAAGTEKQDTNTSDPEGMTVNDAGDESDELKLPLYPYAFEAHLYPVPGVIACSYLQLQVPQRYHAVGTPPPKC